MITLSARCLSRAWLAVQFAAAGPDHPSAQLARAVHVEQYDTGVRLVACDGCWLAHCWVPAWDALETIDATQAGAGTLAEDTQVGVTPYIKGTVRDVDLRVRDLMRFLHRATKPAESLDQPVTLDLAGAVEDADHPTLLPEWAERAAIFTLTSGERVVAEEFDAPWMAWRDIVVAAQRTGDRPTRTDIDPHRLGLLAKVANTIQADRVAICWNRPGTAAWWCEGGNLKHVPAGIFTYRSPDVDLETASGVIVGESVIEDTGRPAAPGAPR